VTIVGAANICYMEAQGCRSEEVRSEIALGKFLQDTKLENSAEARQNAQRRAVEAAYARAFSKLGADGWELVSSPELQFDNFVANSPNSFAVMDGSHQRGPDIYFKRRKQ
jgi:hypothetical protein